MMEDEARVLTVKALRERLLDFPEEALVAIEGCDCEGWALSVKLDEPLTERQQSSNMRIEDYPAGHPCILIRRYA